MKKAAILYFFISILIIGFLFSSNKSVADDKTTEIVESLTLPQIIKSIPLDKNFMFAGELIPKTDDVKNRLDRELSVNAYWHSNTMLNMKAAYKFFPTIERILAEEGVPDDFKYLAVAESGLRNVVSSANAKGFWQFRKLAAKEFGLEVNDEVDERYHLEKSTRAAAKYLKQLHGRFGNWIDAAASYNIGPTSYSKIRTRQEEDNYFNLNLTSETSRYVFRLIAIKEILSNPDVYGFFLENNEKFTPFPDYFEVKVDQSIASWGKFAHKYGISYRELKVHNPWLIDNKLTVKHNTYFINIPK